MTVAEADNAKPRLAAPKPEPAAVVVEEVTEPVKRTSKKAEEADAAKPDLSKILAEWDD
jgi:hypothetical protein